MPPSRQALALRARSLDRLRAQIPPGAPLVAGYSEADRCFTLATPRRPAEVLFAGRYQVVHAFLTGYTFAWLQARGADD